MFPKFVKFWAWHYFSIAFLCSAMSLLYWCMTLSTDFAPTPCLLFGILFSAPPCSINSADPFLGSLWHLSSEPLGKRFSGYAESFSPRACSFSSSYSLVKSIPRAESVWSSVVELLPGIWDALGSNIQLMPVLQKWNGVQTHFFFYFRHGCNRCFRLSAHFSIWAISWLAFTATVSCLCFALPNISALDLGQIEHCLMRHLMLWHKTGCGLFP